MIKFTSNIARRQRAFAKPQFAMISRNFANVKPTDHVDHHHDDHKPAGPYDVPHPHVNDQKAYFPGFDPDYKTEGWEYISVFTVLLCGAILVFVPSMAGHDTFKDWARREAYAREEAQAKGVEIEFGKYYQGVQYKDSDKTGVAPTIVGEDED